ncbi:hypothetical protein LTR27_001938 [Elasticomyces elasticus]|nr:hypothetical protein LTR27_001938 [Elasticomyces elasticus]
MACAYTTDQLEAFFSLIGLPETLKLNNYPQRDLALLTALHVHTISTIPYENLSLHYSAHKGVSLDPTDLYQKIVVNGRGRGGYCMENSLFYLHMLKALGFRVYPVGVRIRLRNEGVPQGNFVGWVHIVNIVTLDDGSRWMVDVGFGGDGATKPLPLIEGTVTPNLGTQDIRLIRDFIPEQTNRSPERKLWLYQYRNGPHMDWNTYYAFSPDLEFFPADFNVMNHWTSTHPSQKQTFTVLAILFLRRPSAGGQDEIYGKRMMVNGIIKENLGGKTVVLKQCSSESERVKALSELFSIRMTSVEVEGIRGHSTELMG